MSIPLSFWLPAWAARMEHQTWLIVVLVACYPVGYVGLIARAGRPAPGCGRCWSASRAAVFPVVLTLIGLRARTSEGTAALSGFTQSVGYLIAAIGPFGMGSLYELTGGWTVPLIGADRAGGPAAGRRAGGRASVVHRGPARPGAGGPLNPPDDPGPGDLGLCRFRPPCASLGARSEGRCSSMRITLRDTVASILVAAIAVPYVGYLLYGSVPFVQDPRGMAAVGLILGFVAFLLDVGT